MVKIARKLTYEEVKHFIEVESGSGCRLISDTYINTREKLKIQCKCGCLFQTSLNEFKHSNKTQCGKCSDNISWNYDMVKQYVEVDSGSDCRLLSETYKNVDSDLLFECNCGNIFTRTLSTFRNSKQMCKECTYKIIASKTRLSLSEVCKVIEDNGCTYVSGKYYNADSKMVVRCKCGNKFDTTLRIIKNGRETCDECSKDVRREHFAHSLDYIEEFFIGNGCVLLSDTYENMNSKLDYIATCGHEDTTTFQSFHKRKYFCCTECAKYLNSGENAYNWKGGYESEKVKFRKTYEFKQWVKGVYKRDNYTCQICGSYGGSINAHHLDGYNWCVEKRTELDNGITLCEGCHNDFHDKYGRGDNTREQFGEYLKLLNKNFINL